jgi:hypothetical protein
VQGVPRTAVTADPEAAYYQAVEEFFVSRRGDPLFLSNTDWLLIRKWRSAGLPLRIVLRGIADALDAHAVSWGRRRKVGSLAYCASEVEAARDRWQRALEMGAEAGAGPAEAVGSFATALRGTPGAGPRSLRLARRLADDLSVWAGEGGVVRDLEPRLQEAEGALLKVLRAEMDPGALRGLEAQVDGELAPYEGRMPARVLGQVRRESLARRILAAHGLPRLSLFEL